MGLDLRCCFPDEGWSRHLQPCHYVEVYPVGALEPVAILTADQLTALVAHYLAQAGLVAGLLPRLAPTRPCPTRKPLAPTLHGLGRRRLRGYGPT